MDEASFNASRAFIALESLIVTSGNTGLLQLKPSDLIRQVPSQELAAELKAVYNDNNCTFRSSLCRLRKKLNSSTSTMASGNFSGGGGRPPTGPPNGFGRNITNSPFSSRKTTSHQLKSTALDQPPSSPFCGYGQQAFGGGGHQGFGGSAYGGQPPFPSPRASPTRGFHGSGYGAGDSIDNPNFFLENGHHDLQENLDAAKQNLKQGKAVAETAWSKLVFEKIPKDAAHHDTIRQLFTDAGDFLGDATLMDDCLRLVNQSANDTRTEAGDFANLSDQGKNREMGRYGRLGNGLARVHNLGTILSKHADDKCKESAEAVRQVMEWHEQNLSARRGVRFFVGSTNRGSAHLDHITKGTHLPEDADFYEESDSDEEDTNDGTGDSSMGGTAGAPAPFVFGAPGNNNPTVGFGTNSQAAAFGTNNQVAAFGSNNATAGFGSNNTTAGFGNNNNNNNQFGR